MLYQVESQSEGDLERLKPNIPRRWTYIVAAWRSSNVSKDSDKDELYRRLAQVHRMIAEPVDPLTKDRLRALALDIESQLATVEARDTDTPE